MANRGSSPRGIRGVLPAIGFVILAFGLCAVSVGVIDAASTADPVVTEAVLAGASTVPGDVGGSWLAAEEDSHGAERACPAPQSHAAQERTRIHALAREDRREYFTRMGELLHRRVAASPAPNPYQASLDPALYARGRATPADSSDLEGISPQPPCRDR